jgi:hypothetical protein
MSDEKKSCCHACPLANWTYVNYATAAVMGVAGLGLAVCWPTGVCVSVCLVVLPVQVLRPVVLVVLTVCPLPTPRCSSPRRRPARCSTTVMLLVTLPRWLCVVLGRCFSLSLTLTLTLTLTRVTDKHSSSYTD